MYKMLLQTPPPIKPPNWTRSRIRRQHLIALGIPVNLDEVLPRANGKPLPPLEIHTRPMSAPPGSRNPHTNLPGQSNHNSRAGTPQPGQQGIFSQFGPKPELDTGRINKLLQLTTGVYFENPAFMHRLINISRIVDYTTTFQLGTISS